MFLGNAQHMERFVASAVCALVAMGCVVSRVNHHLGLYVDNRLLLLVYLTYHVAAVWWFGLFIGQSHITGLLID